MLLAIILTVRLNSERLPNKALTRVRNKPLVYWIMRRLQKVANSQVILATTRNKSDDPLIEIADNLNVPVYRGNENDLVERVDRAYLEYAPEANYLLRALGDCPFISTELIERTCEVLEKHNREAMLWYLPPETWPVYGARELPYSISAWNKIARKAAYSDQREHVDMFFHQNRNMFRVMYHEPPDNVYFRPYRLEVDYPEDAEMIQAIGAKIGMLSPLPDVIKFLDQNEDIAKLNRERVEKTGPTSSYSYQQRRLWWRYMSGQPFLGWNDKWYRPKTEQSTPIFCKCGQECLGYADYGVLYTMDGNTIEAGKVKCSCGLAVVWNEARERAA